MAVTVQKAINKSVLYIFSNRTICPLFKSIERSIKKKHFCNYCNSIALKFKIIKWMLLTSGNCRIKLVIDETKMFNKMC